MVQYAVMCESDLQHVLMVGSVSWMLLYPYQLFNSYANLIRSHKATELILQYHSLCARNEVGNSIELAHGGRGERKSEEPTLFPPKFLTSPPN
ncbi:hypothetical protein VNO77_24075 [Canavalia gladiata]|uniref:Uncharacterized protein n=1 Tax=Canavalia gladiata TaxID=3824 RepID=A0AAN9L630_CANGL